jgi:hypothetical protein
VACETLARFTRTPSFENAYVSSTRKDFTIGPDEQRSEWKLFSPIYRRSQLFDQFFIEQIQRRILPKLRSREHLTFRSAPYS